MSDIKEALGTEAQTITCSIATLANAAARESTAVDNSSNLFREVLVMLAVKNHASSAPTGDKAVYVYVYGTVDAATPLYPDAVTGSDAGITLDSPTHLRPLGTLLFTAAAQTKKGGPWSLAAAFGGRVPKKWGIVIVNATGFSLDTTEGNHQKKYQGFYDTVT
jgi:hypothetical protein